jgi:hypothetical protein
MSKNHDIIEVAGEFRHKTEKAYQFFDGSMTVWVPPKNRYEGACVPEFSLQ